MYSCMYVCMCTFVVVSNSAELGGTWHVVMLKKVTFVEKFISEDMQK